MNPSPIFDQEESAENESHKVELFKLVASRNAILFVGAGSSQRCGYPDWSSLANRLGKIVKLAPPSASELKKDSMRALNFIEQVKACVGARDDCLDEYHSELQRIFAPKKPKNHEIFHEDLVRLPFRAIITSNYDEVLESAIAATYGSRAEMCDIDDEAKASCSQFLRSLNGAQTLPAILHVHGVHSKPTKIILSDKDYVRA